MLLAHQAQYLHQIYAQLVCAHCDVVQSKKHNRYVVVLHHPNNDGHLGRADDILADDPNWFASVDAEVARCLPLLSAKTPEEKARIVEKARATRQRNAENETACLNALVKIGLLEFSKKITRDERMRRLEALWKEPFVAGISEEHREALVEKAVEMAIDIGDEIRSSGGMQ